MQRMTWAPHLLLHVWLLTSLLLPIMLFVLWIAHQFGIGITKSKKRWLLIGASYGLIKVCVSCAGESALGIHGFGPLGGSQYWTLFLLPPAQRVESWRTSWTLGNLVAAMTEITISCGLAALSWWILRRICEQNRQTLIGMEQYVMSLLFSACIFGFANNLSLWRPATCADCFFPYGFPFTFYHDGGYAGGAGFVWRGIVADSLILVIFGFLFGYVWNRLSQNPSVGDITI
jgi:hypothetical protein